MQLLGAGGKPIPLSSHDHVASGCALFTERLQENATKLPAERAVQNEVDGAVERHQEVAYVRKNPIPEVGAGQVRIQGVGEIVGERRNLADDEDRDDGDQHQRHVILARLVHVHSLPVGT